MPLAVTPEVLIPDSDLSIAFVRASGPGGQNINKLATAVQLRFDLAGTAVLDERTKERARALAGRRLTNDGAILIIAREHRTQERNRAEAYARLGELIARALVQPRRRVPTRPTQAARERRLAGKSHARNLKRLRSRVRWEE